jgi:hypothetical protein
MKRYLSSISALIGATSINTASAVAAYHTLSSDDLPPANAAAARPAPLKGFLTSPEWHTGGYTNPQYYNDPDSTLEFYYIGLSDIMTGMNSFPGFDTVVEPRIAASVSRGKHSILRFYMDYPRPEGSYVSHTPQFLIDDASRVGNVPAHHRAHIGGVALWETRPHGRSMVLQGRDGLRREKEVIQCLKVSLWLVRWWRLSAPETSAW